MNLIIVLTFIALHNINQPKTSSGLVALENSSNRKEVFE